MRLPRSLTTLSFLALLVITHAARGVPARAADPCAAPTLPPPPPQEQQQETGPVPNAGHVIHISELLVNPIGVDTAGEFIELLNAGTTVAELTGWALADAKGKTFALGGIVIPPESYVALPYTQTKITLVNTGGTIILTDPTGMIRSSVTYGGNSKEGQSFAREADGSYAWVDAPTPGAPNFAEQDALEENNDAANDADIDGDANNDATDDSADSGSGNAGSGDNSDESNDGGSGSENADIDNSLPISALRDIPDGTTVHLRGIVTLPPGRVGTTIFAVQAPNGSAGTYLRMYATERPMLVVGDEVAIVGKIAYTGGSLRLTTGKDGVLLTGARPGVVPEPVLLDAILPFMDGIAVTVHGALVESGKGWFRLADESGRSELRVDLEGSEKITVPPDAILEVSGVIRYLNGMAELLADDASIVLHLPTQESGANNSNIEATAGAATAGSSAFMGGGDGTPSPVVGGILALSPVAASLGVLGWKKFRGIPMALS